VDPTPQSLREKVDFEPLSGYKKREKKKEKTTKGIPHTYKYKSRQNDTCL